MHSFVEKPMAVDGPGLRTFIQACKDAKAKNLSLVNGFCWRYDGPRRETMKQVFDGKIGDIVAIETTYNSQGVWDPRKTREQCSSDMEYQMRNWYYYCWLSGDHIVEQAVHGIDTMDWVMGDKLPDPVLGRRAAGSRAPTPSTATSTTTSRSSTSIPTTSAATTTAATGSNTPNQVKDYILGTKGIGRRLRQRASPARTTGATARAEGPNGDSDMYQVEHDEMFAAIRAGKPINNGEQAANSTLLAIMGRDGRLHRPGHHLGAWC